MTRSRVQREFREDSGILRGLLRLPAGIEDVNDIFKDLKQAREKT